MYILAWLDNSQDKHRAATSHLHLLTRKPGTASWGGWMLVCWQKHFRISFQVLSTPARLLRTEGGFFTFVLLNCDAPGMMQRISQTGKITHRSISAASDPEGPCLGLQKSSGCTFPFPTSACPGQGSEQGVQQAPKGNHCSDLSIGITQCWIWRSDIWMFRE